MKRAGLAAILIHLLPAAWAGSPGATGAEILRFSPGARAAALGDAVTGLADDAETAALNPAGLGGLTAGQASATHAKVFEDVTDQRLILAWPARRTGTWALGYHRLATEDFLGFDAQGNRTADRSSQSSAFSLGWGKNLAPGPDRGAGLLAGVTLRALEEEHADVSARAFSADLGLLARPWTGGWLRRAGVGLAARHLGSGASFDRDDSPLPTEYALGASYSHFFSGDVLTAVLDLRSVSREGTSWGAGIEYALARRLALRAGYRTTDVDGAAVRLGAGFRAGPANLDYAWAPAGDDLEAVHRFTVGFRFGPAPAPGVAADLYRDALEQGRKSMETGRYDLAILRFQEALDIRPDDAEAQRLLEECGRRMRGE